MFSFKGIINKIFKRKAKTQPAPEQSRASQPLTGKRFFGERGGSPPAVDRGSKHYKGSQRPRNWKQRRKVRRLMAKASRRINRKLV